LGADKIKEHARSVPNAKFNIKNEVISLSVKLGTPRGGFSFYAHLNKGTVSLVIN